MYHQDHHSSDLDSISSGTSDVTSRATTIPHTWSATTLQEKLNQLNQYNIHPIDDDEGEEVSSVSTDTTARMAPIHHINVNAQRASISQSNAVTTQNQQQPWVNPYWGPNSQSGTTVTQSETSQTNNNSNNGDSAPPKHVKQLIPGSILINDEGEIDDLLWKQNRELNSSTSSTSFNPGGQYISDESGGTGGYLAPTHTQRRTITSSPPRQTAHSPNHFDYNGSNSSSDSNTGDRSQLNRQTTLPETINNNNNNQPWVNPYWSKSNQNGSHNPQVGKSQPSSNSKQYAENKSSEKPTTTTESWQNSYLINDTTSNQNTNNAELNKPFKFPHKTSPIPSFYHRIYPPPTPLSSPVPTLDTKHDTMFFNEKSQADTHNDEDSSYTLDRQGIVHYRTTSSASNITNKKPNDTSPSINQQYSVIPPHKSSPISFSQTTNTTSFSQTTASTVPSFINNMTSNLNYPSSSFNYDAYPSSKSVPVLTETDLYSIHEALHLLETNPNGIPIIETSNQIPSSRINHRSNLPSTITSLFTANHDEQPTSARSQNVRFNSQQLPPTNTSLFTNNHQEQPTSARSQNEQFNSYQFPPIITSLFTTNREEQPTSARSQNVRFNSQQLPSTITSLFTTNREEQPTSALSQTVRYNPQQPPLFSTPSYPSSSSALSSTSQLLRNLAAQKLINLI